MTKQKYSKADMAQVSDNPELSAEEIAAARPFSEVFPDLSATMRRARGPQKAPTKVSTTIRLSPDVVDYFKQGAAGWQSRIDDALKEWMVAHR